MAHDEYTAINIRDYLYAIIENADDPNHDLFETLTKEGLEDFLSVATGEYKHLLDKGWDDNDDTAAEAISLARENY